MSDRLLGEDGLNPTQDSTESRARTRRRTRRAFVAVLSVLMAVLLAVSGVAVWYVKSLSDTLNSMQRSGDLLPSQTWTPPAGDQSASSDPITILLVGTDSRGDERGRSDALILAHISGDRKSIHLVSLPRDYWVNVPGHGEAKINAAYSWGGAPLAVETVQELLGVHIDHVAITDFQGFEDAIDAIGGVTVYNDQASTWGGYSWPQGQVTLETGDEARWYVGQRYDLAEGDFDRQKRQRDVIVAVVNKLASRGVLTDPVRFRDAVTSLGPSFTVDDGLTNDRLTSIAMSLARQGSPTIRSYSAPYSGFGVSEDQQSYVEVDEERLAKLGQALREDEMETYFATR